MDGDAPVEEPADQRVHRVRLPPDALGAVVVVVEPGGGIRRMGEPEGLGDVVLPARAEEVGVAEAAAVGDRLVDDVPRPDAPRVAPHEGLDVHGERASRLAPRERRRQPAGELAVPYEGVAVNAHPVRLGERDQPVRGLEAPLALGGMDPLPLHRVLGRNRAELPHDRGPVRRVALEQIRLDRRPDRHPCHRAQRLAALLHVVRVHRISGRQRRDCRGEVTGPLRSPQRGPLASPRAGTRKSHQGCPVRRTTRMRRRAGRHPERFRWAPPRRHHAARADEARAPASPLSVVRGVEPGCPRLGRDGVHEEPGAAAGRGHRPRLLRGVVQQAQARQLLSTEHFTVDGTLIEAWAGLKSFKRRDAAHPAAG